MDNQFCNMALQTMQHNNAWFISELNDLTRRAKEATENLEQHRQAMADREIIMTRLKEMTQ